MLKKTNEKLTVFLHVPKTAGTCIRDLLNQNFLASEIYDPRSSLGLLEVKDAKLALKEKKILSSHSGVFGDEINGRPLRYFTMLRSPVERVISFWLHALRDPLHFAHDQAIEYRFAEFIEGEFFADTHNYQTRLVAGVNSLEGLYQSEYLSKKITEKELLIAKENLITLFDFVGIQEQFYYSYTGISNLLGLPLTGSKPRKVASANQRKASKLSLKDLEIVAEANKLDMELYSFAGQLFKKSCKEIKFRDVAVVWGKSIITRL